MGILYSIRHTWIADLGRISLQSEVHRSARELQIPGTYYYRAVFDICSFFYQTSRVCPVTTDASVICHDKIKPYIV